MSLNVVEPNAAAVAKSAAGSNSCCRPGPRRYKVLDATQLGTYTRTTTDKEESSSSTTHESYCHGTKRTIDEDRVGSIIFPVDGPNFPLSTFSSQRACLRKPILQSWKTPMVLLDEYGIAHVQQHTSSIPNWRRLPRNLDKKEKKADLQEVNKAWGRTTLRKNKTRKAEVCEVKKVWSGCLVSDVSRSTVRIDETRNTVVCIQTSEHNLHGIVPLQESELEIPIKKLGIFSRKFKTFIKSPGPGLDFPAKEEREVKVKKSYLTSSKRMMQSAFTRGTTRDRKQWNTSCSKEQ